ncbi:hypothetical protein GCM10027262_75180 [Nocardia tengchongensis]
MARLRGFPEISREELFRFFTLTPADIAFVAPCGRGQAVRLGLAVALMTDNACSCVVAPTSSRGSFGRSSSSS